MSGPPPLAALPGLLAGEAAIAELLGIDDAIVAVPAAARAVVLAARRRLARRRRCSSPPRPPARPSSLCTIWRRFSGMRRSSCCRPGRRSPSSGSRRRPRRWAGGSGRCGGCATAPASDVRPGCGAGHPCVVVAPIRALLQRLGPRVEDTEPVVVRRGAGARPRGSRRTPRARRLPARVPGRGAGRARRAGRHRRRLPLDGEPGRSGSTCSATRSSG